MGKSTVNWTEEQVTALYSSRTANPVMVAKPQVRKRVPVRVHEGPLDVTLVLYGHCPSKKNCWRRSEGGGMFIPEEEKSQINILTTQALLQWGRRDPVEHPDVTVKFFVAAKRQDEDGMWTTVLDCLQKAGVLVNDNLAKFNGRKVHEPAEFVSEQKERVEIRMVKA